MKIGLGTVQFGLPYGISNTLGQVPLAEVRAILSLAAARGIDCLDTAADYGESETALGACLPDPQPFRVITKTVGLRVPRLAPSDVEKVEQHFRRSLQRLGQSSVHGLLVHHASDLLAENGRQLWERLERLRADGVVAKIGVSVYSPDELQRVLAEFPINLVQLPLNVFDQRFLATGDLRRLQAAGVEVHARSIFLQGLLLMNPTDLSASLGALRPVLQRYHDSLRAEGLSPLAGVLRFGSQVPEVDRWIVGVCSQAQLREILEARPAPGTPPLDFQSFAVADESLINPARWKN